MLKYPKTHEEFYHLIRDNNIFKEFLITNKFMKKSSSCNCQYRDRTVNRLLLK